jgi:hypothetical protein
VATLTEQSTHVLGGDLVTAVDALQADQAGPEPPAGSLALLGVVGVQPDVTLVGRVQGSNLPRQVRVPIAGSQLVERHHTAKHTTTPVVQKVCGN